MWCLRHKIDGLQVSWVAGGLMGLRSVLCSAALHVERFAATSKRKPTSCFISLSPPSEHSPRFRTPIHPDNYWPYDGAW